MKEFHWQNRCYRLNSVPSIRIQACNRADINGVGDYVLYWMIAARRITSNFALDRAIEWSLRLHKPLLIFEALRWEFPWETERTRRFVIDGMKHNLRALQGTNVLYYPYVELAHNSSKGLLASLANRAAVIVTDEFPCFFLPSMVAAAAKKVPVLLEQVDSNGLLPLRAAPKEFTTAFAFRRFLQKDLPAHLLAFPSHNPLSRANLTAPKPLPKSIVGRWPPASFDSDHASAKSRSARKPPVELRGGRLEARKHLENFLSEKLEGYAEERNHPDKEAASGLSPYLHFGHISSHEIFSSLANHEHWTSERLALRPTGSRAGWWGMSTSAEAFLDQFVTWRELGFNMCHLRKDYDRFSSLPAWAQQTLTEHKGDPRQYRYTPEQFDTARTHDPLWNAAQIQLLTEGRIHNYLRMIWGKKILEWTRSPMEALKIMIELNNRYALDGRDPNSFTGIFWCLGRYDRPWGPERPIFGTVRYMSSANTMRKLRVKKYLQTYGPKLLNQLGPQ